MQPTDHQVKEWTPKEIDAEIDRYVSGDYLHKCYALDIAVRVLTSCMALVDQARLERNAARRIAYNLEQELAECKSTIIQGEL